MRIFHVTNSADAEKIASYLIKARIGFSITYTYPDIIRGPARFVFKLLRHKADNIDTMQRFAEFRSREGISVVAEPNTY